MKFLQYAFARKSMALALCVFMLTAVLAHAGGPLVVFANRPVVFRSTAFPLTWRLDPGTLGSYSNAQAAEIVAESFDAWQNIPTATPSFKRGTDLPTDITVSNYTNYWGKFTDGINPIILDSDGQIVDAIRGSGAKNQTLGLAVFSYSDRGAEAGFIIESEVLINGFLSNKASIQQYVGVVKHELGHLLGLDHAQISKHEGLDGYDANDAVVPLMFPLSTTNFDFTADDIWSVSMLYPTSSFLNNRGTLRGTIKRRDGTAVRGANVVAISTADSNDRYSAVTDYFGNAPGIYEFKGLPPGDYYLFAEPIVDLFTGGSSVGPYAKNGADLSFVKPIQFEYYNGAQESYDHLADRPDDRVSIAVAAGQITDQINFLANDAPNQVLDRYFADSAAAYIQLPFVGSNTYVATAMRFSPSLSGKLLWIRVFFNGGASGIQGTGTLRFSIWRPRATNPKLPGTVEKQIDVPLNQLTRGLVIPYEAWVGDRDIAITAGQDFFVSVEVVGEGAVQLLLDDGVTQPTFRTSVRSRAGTWLSNEQVFQKPYNAMIAAAIGGQQPEIIPLAFQLEQNYPNPLIIGKTLVDPQTTIRFVLPQDSRVELTIFDLLGRKIRTLTAAEFPKGYNTVFWNGRDANGYRVPAGIYFYRLRAGNDEQVKKLTLVR